MPPASSDLQERWSTADAASKVDALKHLRANGFVISRGNVIFPPLTFDPEADDVDCMGAVNFLHSGWDYGWGGPPEHFR